MSTSASVQIRLDNNIKMEDLQMHNRRLTKKERDANVTKYIYMYIRVLDNSNSRPRTITLKASRNNNLLVSMMQRQMHHHKEMKSAQKQQMLLVRGEGTT
jgi:hypothetical protein